MIEPDVKKIGVVFIHGFTGNAVTWMNSSGERFCDMLSSETQICEEYELFEFHYYTQIVDIFKSATVQNLKKILNKIPFVSFDTKVQKNKPIRYLSNQLNSYLRTELEDFDEVVLVAHSMGGLIAKDHILNYVPGEGPRPIGYVSMAVPHKGSIGALLLSPSANVNAKEMQPLSEYADALNTEWYERKDELPKCVYLIATHDECVPEVSSLPYKVKTADKFTLNHDHTSICKPDNKKDLSYKRVKRFLEEISYHKSMTSIASVEYLGDDDSFNKEAFVIKLILSEVGEMGVEDAKASFFHAEIISKAARKDDKEHLIDLQTKVLSIYRQTFNGNRAKTADKIFLAVHKELRDQDDKLLSCAVKYINFLHKGGLLHQLANKVDRTVIWDKNVTDDDVREQML
ncbi:hypothetical protein K5D69_23525 [Pseudomonas cichorii]|uniref:ABC-three component system protein n=1 Tax=Pseudomonas cichorii TaxID=36746 RepID=UPI001C8A3CD4|nr:ABC-three component system protein [Pseudomonas cichorii]MBX8517657.1 hypothetical protein [Pseudomonas cichorii]